VRLGFSALSQEIVGNIADYLGLEDLASVSMACQNLKAKFEPYLYETVDFSLLKRPYAHLLSLLGMVSCRPTVASYIRTLNIPDIEKNNSSHAKGEFVRKAESKKYTSCCGAPLRVIKP
jgi:hypothetical protein